jgi:hypothetical protein
MFEGWGAAIVGATVVGGVVAAKASSKASSTQANADQAAIDSSNSQFDKAAAILKPYVDAGTGSLTAQQDLIGLNGADAAKSAIDKIQNGPQFQAMTKQGETSILQNASATGGLRGGNTQAALAEFRPQLLSQLITDQYNKLGGITQIGQASAAGQASSSIQQGAVNAGLLQDQGAAIAGGQLAQGQAISGVANSVAGYGVLKKAKVF